MVVNSVGEEYSFCVHLEILVVLAFPVSVILGNDGLEHLPQGKVAGAVLVPVDVPAPFCRLSKVVNVFLLLERKFLPSGNRVPDYLQIGKFIQKIAETIRAFFFGGVAGNCCE